jgi:hypothetical protein
MSTHLHADIAISLKLNKMDQFSKFRWQTKQHVVANPQNAQLRHQLHTSEATKESVTQREKLNRNFITAELFEVDSRTSVNL